MGKVVDFKPKERDVRPEEVALIKIYHLPASSKTWNNNEQSMVDDSIRNSILPFDDARESIKYSEDIEKNELYCACAGELMRIGLEMLEQGEKNYRLTAQTLGTLRKCTGMFQGFKDDEKLEYEGTAVLILEDAIRDAVSCDLEMKSIIRDRDKNIGSGKGNDKERPKKRK